MIKVNIENAQISNEDILKFQDQVEKIHQNLAEKAKDKTQYCGWIEMPFQYENDLNFKEIWNRMEVLALKLKQDKVSVLVVIGIGGSYLGARAAIEMANGLLPTKNDSNSIKVIYCGNTLSSTYTSQLLSYLADKDFAINVISKSGTTTEPAIAFRLLKELLLEKHANDPEKIRNRIIVTTDESKGLLHDIAVNEEYPMFFIPQDIGGRFSVLSPVGIFPMLVANVDVAKVITGAQKAYYDCKSDKIFTNPAYLYAVSRYFLYSQKNKSIEILGTYELQMQTFCEWWKQLFGESEGKENKGLFPASVAFTTDLHSLGQFIQDGSKIFFETIIKVKEPNLDVTIPKLTDDSDCLNYLANKTLHHINEIACQGTIAAHSNYQLGNVPNIILEWEAMDSEMFGYASYFFMRACAMSACLLQVNPFDQPGVEIYKKNMFELLGKK